MDILGVREARKMFWWCSGNGYREMVRCLWIPQYTILYSLLSTFHACIRFNSLYVYIGLPFSH